MAELSWTVVVPVKRLDAAKSRLRGAVDDVPHELLALALAKDTVSAALAAPGIDEVLVVTEDHRAAVELRALGARIIPDPPGGGLNPALTLGASLVADRWVAALTADLPALRPTDLAAALRHASVTAGHAGFGPGAVVGPNRVRRFVADAPGTGTVLLTTAPGLPLGPRFGPGSAATHAATGAQPLIGAWPTLRRDVDTPADLAAAAALGLGRHTDALLSQPRPHPLLIMRLSAEFRWKSTITS